MSLQELTPEGVASVFEQYKNDADRCREAEIRLFRFQERDSWIECYKTRSRAIREAFEHNNELSSTLFAYIAGEKALTAELAEAIFNEQMALDVSRYDDPFLAVKLLKMLIDFYLPTGDLVHLLPLYNRLGWEASTTMRMGYEENFDLAFSSYRFIIDHRYSYASFSDISLRRLFFVAYYNIICVFPSFNHPFLSLDDSVSYMKELKLFYHSDIVRSLDADNDVINNLYRYTHEQFLSLEKDLEKALPETIKYYCDLALRVYDVQLGLSGDLYKVSPEAVISRQRALAIRKEITYTAAIQNLLEYYNERRRRTRGMPIPEDFEIDSNFYFESRIPVAIFNLFDNAPDCDPEFKRNTLRYVIKCKDEFFDALTRSTSNYSPYINESLADWSLKVFCQLETIEEKEHIIFNNIINRQISTFFHSHMVEVIAVFFVDSMLEHRPDLLLPVVEAHSVNELKELTEEIREYIRKAALLHDIGKNFIPDVINKQTRRLTDEEFAVIRKHPRIGAEAIDEDFILYHDIILGHHRSYDCRSGYPFDFDPSHSNLKIIIDLIAICDSLDAATDYLGRNYAIRKDMTTVLKELREGAGTRYNPDLVSLLDSDKVLYSKLDDLITHGREDLYYTLFSEHFMEKKQA